MAKLTPMMQQYMDIKEKHRDCILFFRLGDFYEMFFDDALIASKELEIALTARDCGLPEKAPMCGVPYHSADSYIAKLIEKSFKVAICEQVEDPSEAVGIVKRDVVKIITSGTKTDPKMLDDKSNNYLCTVYFDESNGRINRAGISYADITTGEIYSTELEIKEDKDLVKIVDELGKIMPGELLINIDILSGEYRELFLRFENVINVLDSWYFERDLSENNLKNQFKTDSLSGIGIYGDYAGMYSTGALLEYLNETQKTHLDNIRNLKIYSIENFMVMDINTRRNLELLESIRGNKKKGSLLSVLDYTHTSMGGRLIKRWIEEPLLDKSEIEERHNIIEDLFSDIILMDKISDELKNIYDIERLIGRVVQGSSNGRVLISIKNSVAVLPGLKQLLSESDSDNLKKIAEQIDTLEDVYDLIDESIEDDCPIGVKEGKLIKEDYSEELKELRNISRNGKLYLLEIEEKEREKTGIKNLKISYNKVFGYYIEVTKSNIDRVPDRYIRKQTLANSERYIVDELKEVENKILNSRDRMIDLEYELFNQVREKVKEQVERVQTVAKIIASLDVLLSFTKAAYFNNYVRPVIVEPNTDARVDAEHSESEIVKEKYGPIDIRDGRHPVVEKMIDDGAFVSNDTYLDTEDSRLDIITGPNMSGKSTYMRQVALITLMAQIGSYVPASYAKVSLVDKIFTRIGATDDLSEGQSTFMVEMTEVANILNNATEKSLIILDEIGRGTSTYDGLSIAWAVIEYIASKDRIGAKTLFATHYHELTELENKVSGIKNYRISVEEKAGSGIVFLRKIERGGANRSYGIEVAKLAGISTEVTDRAYEILEKLEEEDINRPQPSQISLFGDENQMVSEPSDKPASGKSRAIEAKESWGNKEDAEKFEKLKSVEKELKEIDIINMTPLDAMNILYKLTGMVD